jgi:hypothetical protein
MIPTWCWVLACGPIAASYLLAVYLLTRRSKPYWALDWDIGRREGDETILTVAHGSGKIEHYKLEPSDKPRWDVCRGRDEIGKFDGRVVLPKTLYDLLKAEGVDMTGFIESKPIPPLADKVPTEPVIKRGGRYVGKHPALGAPYEETDFLNIDRNHPTC